MSTKIKTSVSLALQENSQFSPFPAEKAEEGFQWAERLGFDGVELIIKHPAEVDAVHLSKTLESRHLSVSTIATGQMMGEGLVFCSEDANIRKLAIKRIFEHVDLSVRLGYPNITIGLARGKGDTQRQSIQRGWIAECTRQCASYAYMKKVRINLEPINRYETFLLNSVADTANLIREIGAPPNVGILYDTFHSNIEDVSVPETIRVYGPNFSHVHFADSNRMVPGNGHIDFPGIVAGLKGVGYSGFVSLECLNVPTPEFVMEHAGNINTLIRDREQ